MNETDLYKKTLFKSTIAFALHEGVFDDEGNLVDYIYLEANPAFQEATGLDLKCIMGKRFKAEITKVPDEATKWIKFFEQVLKTGKELAVEEYSQEFGSQYYLHAYPLDEKRFVTLLRDTNNEYKMEQITSYFLDHVGKKIDYRLLTKMGLEFSHADYAIFNTYDERTSSFTPKAMVSKLNNHEQLLQFLELPVSGTKWRPGPHVDKFKQNYMLVDFEELDMYTGSILSKEQLITAAQKFNLGKVVLSIIKTNDQILGNFLFVFNKGNMFFNTSYLNIYLKQLGVFIEKCELEENLYLKKLETELMEHQLKKDILTNAYNRSVINSLLTDRLLIAAKEKLSSYIVIIDMDNFKQINDAHGHLLGDAVLRMFVEKLESLLRGSDLLVRIGGDEFLIYLHDVESESDARSIMERIFQNLSSIYEVKTVEGKVFSLEVKISSGLAKFPNDGLTVKELMNKADYTMYRVKRAGKNGFDFFSIDKEF